MAKSKKEEGELLFKAFMEKALIVVADPHSSSRAGIAKTLSQMGAKGPNIATASTFEMAETEIARVKPAIVVCDYEMGGQSGLNLLQKQRQENPDSKRTLFALVTGNSSQSAVAQAAEEDVDTFILKPYTLETFKTQLTLSVLGKINPSEYVKKINEGKDTLFKGDIDAAIGLFIEAAKLHPKPALAHFYMGQAKLMKQMMDEAKGSYGDGLASNKMHYKCLVGLFDLLMERKESKDAYDIVKKISRYFPANPKRLTQVLRLAILTGSYEDIEAYYQSFTTIDTRNEELVKFVCAALVVCGKYYLKSNYLARANELFQKAAITAAGRTKILREIITALCEFDLFKDAQEYLKRFPPGEQSKADFLAMDLLVASKLLVPTALLEKTRAVAKHGHEDPIIYRVSIQAAALCGYADQATDLADKAKAKFPKMAEVFDAAAKAAPTPETKPNAA